MKATVSKSILVAGFLFAGAVGANAEGCSYGHGATAEAQPVIEKMMVVADESQVLTTGQISVAQIDCAASPDAPECSNASQPLTN